MTRTENIPIVVTSSTTADVNGEPILVEGNALIFQVLQAGANLAQLEGSNDGVTFVDLNYDNAAGAYTLTVLNTLGAGLYNVFERPKYVRMVVATDAGGAGRDYVANLLVKKESD